MIAFDRPALVLVSGYYLASRRLELLLGSLAAVPIAGRILAHTVLPWVARASWPLMVRGLFAPQPPDSFATFPAELTFRPSQLRASARETALLNPSVKGLFKRLRVIGLPITAIAGADDKVVDPAHSGQLARKVPGTSLEVLPDQGHMVHHTSAEQVVDAIRRMQEEYSRQ